MLLHIHQISSPHWEKLSCLAIAWCKSNGSSSHIYILFKKTKNEQTTVTVTVTVTNIAMTEDQQPHQLSACCDKAKDRTTPGSDVI